MVAHQAHRFSDKFQGAMERPAEVVQEYPLSSMLLMFGVGIGVGVVVAQALTSTFHELTEDPTMTEKVKRQAFDALSHVLTPSMMKQLQSYTHS
jgi:hypothetical protein